MVLITAMTATSIWLILSAPIFSSTDAFLPRPLVVNRGGGRSFDPFRSSSSSTSSRLLSSTTAAVKEIETKPIPGMKPGTSGLRKKVEVWQAVDPSNTNYLENFIQALIDTAANKNGGIVPKTILVAGDGRYFNNEATKIICRVLAANGVQDIWVPSGGIMSTPAVSAAIRERGNGECEGGIVLTASHNPGGPGEDFGIKYNLAYGQPAGEDFTDELYERSLELKSFKTLDMETDIDVHAAVGSTFQLTESSTVTIIDPFKEYVKVLKKCFDFEALSNFAKRAEFSMIFDGMHGAGGPFAQRILIEELGLPKSTLFRCNSLPDFGQCHPDPNLTYASELVQKMGLLSNGNENPDMDKSQLPTLGVANDGDGDRNLIAGAGCFVTPSDSLAIICDNWAAIPHFANAGGPRGVARSMPSSAALDVVAAARDIPCFCTPTGWKFFGNLMGSKEQFGGTDYTPFLCGEESFGTGSDHVREKDGLWAALAWMSIIMKANENTPQGSSLVSVKDIVVKHWSQYGRHFYCRYDYENVASDAANKVMNLIREEFVQSSSNHVTKEYSQDDTILKLVDAEEFSYVDPVDGSQTSQQGLILHFQYHPSQDTARVVFRLSGTGSSGATIRMYLEKYERDSSKHMQSAPDALQFLATSAIQLVKLQEFTGRDAPTVIT